MTSIATAFESINSAIPENLSLGVKRRILDALVALVKDTRRVDGDIAGNLAHFNVEKAIIQQTIAIELALDGTYITDESDLTNRDSDYDYGYQESSEF